MAQSNGDLNVSGATITNDLAIMGLDCTANANGGALTADVDGIVVCSDDDGNTGPHTVDTDTTLSEGEVDAFVANNGYSTGSHTVDTSRSNASILQTVADNGYVTGAHTTNTHGTDSWADDVGQVTTIANVGLGTDSPGATLHLEPDPRIGTGTISSSANIVTGTGTSFTTEVKPGNTIAAQGQVRVVKRVDSDTSLYITGQRYSPNIGPDAKYTIGDAGLYVYDTDEWYGGPIFMVGGKQVVLGSQGDSSSGASVRVKGPTGWNLLNLQSSGSSISEAVYHQWGSQESFRYYVDNSATLHMTRGSTTVIFVTSPTRRVGILRNPTTNAFEVSGNASKTTVGDWLANSDRRIKQNIQDLDGALALIDQLHPVRFRYTEDYIDKNEVLDPERYYYSFIAQEFQEVFPDNVQDDGEGLLQVDAYPVRPYLVKGVQELHGLVQGQQEQIDYLVEAQLLQIDELIEAQRKQFEVLAQSERDLKAENTQLKTLLRSLASRVQALEHRPGIR